MVAKLLVSLLVITFAAFSSVLGTKRQISCSVFPSYNDSDVHVIHVTARGPTDTIHFLWSTYKLPSIIVARTTIDAKVHFDLAKLKLFQEGGITFNETAVASMGFTISRLLQFTYKDDTADVTDPVNITSIDLASFVWDEAHYEKLHCSDTAAYVRLKSFSTDEVFSNNGTFQIQFSVVGDQESAGESPHLIYNSNSTQLQISFDNFHTDNSRTRYGLEALMVSPLSEKCSETNCQILSTKSISDESSPGIFSDVDALPPCSVEDNEKGAFITWRPVSYTSNTEPSVANSCDAKLTSDCSAIASTTIQSIAQLYFADQENISSNAFNITFGTVGDGFYPKNKFTSWSVMVGTGVAVHTSLSVSGIVFISVGLGALTLFLLTGGVFYSVRWCRKKDDDLLLSESYVN